MNEADKNGNSLSFGNNPPMSDEEWKQFWEKAEAEMSPQLSPEELQVHEDMNWILFDPELQEKYPDKVVAAVQRRVVAVGDNIADVAREAARITGLPWNRIAVAQVLGTKSLFGPR